MVFNFTLWHGKIVYLVIAPGSVAYWEGKLARDIKDFPAFVQRM